MGPINTATNVETIAVIGAGPVGLAAAKYLAAEKAFTRIVVFEQRLSVGGVWNATPTIKQDENFHIPQTSPSPIPGNPQPVSKGEIGKLFQFLSPVYDDLDTNIPHTLMNYSDLPFPKGTPLFPHHTLVLEYLGRYADDLRQLIQFGIQVLDVQLSSAKGRDKWLVRTRNLKTKEEKTDVFDAVIVSNGHYEDPFVPSVTGIKEWNAAYPGIISHSKFYRQPEEYRDKKVIIVGNSASGTDLASQVAPAVRSPLLISVRTPSRTASSVKEVPDAQRVELPEITEFIIQDRSVRFKNNHVETNVDAIIFCTGYLYSFPFLQTLSPPVTFSSAPSSQASPESAPFNTITGTYVPHLYQHLFYIPRPTLTFLALPYRIVPFPLSESQASVVARFLAGRLSLPSEVEMKNWETDLLRRKALEEGSLKNIHILGYPADAEYINYLASWAAKAIKKTGLENDGLGKLPWFWDEETCWVREMTPRIKEAARSLDPVQKARVKTLEELGFVYPGKNRSNDGSGE